MTLTVDEALQRGVAAHQAGNIAEADKYYTAVLNAQPKHPDANHNMGVLGVGVGKLEEALPFFKTAIEVNPNVDHFWISYISALIDVGRSDEARSSLKLVRENGAQGDAFDQLDQRIQEKLGLAAVTPRDPPQENLQDLVNFFNHGNFNKSLALIDTLYQKFPVSPLLNNLHGHALSQLGSFDSAAVCFKNALNILSNCLVPYDSEHAIKTAVLKNLQAVLIEKGDLDEAIDCTKRILEFKADCKFSYNDLGNLENLRGNFEFAKLCYSKALALDPEFALAQSNMGVLLELNDDLESALESYKKVLKIQ